MKIKRHILKFDCGFKGLILFFALLLLVACQEPKNRTAAEILGHPNFPAIAYGGYRNADRSQAPEISDLKEDLKILQAMGIKILRTYHARLYEHTPRLLQAIRDLKTEDPDFEMYLMLGVWMQCEGAWTDHPVHSKGDTVENTAELRQAVKLAQEYPDIIKIIAVGNEAMVHWAASYYVHPRIILKGVQHLQDLKEKGELPADLWITSSDNFASWGGGEESYHLPALDSLIEAVDYLSVHSYPFHDTHYNPEWWWQPEGQDSLSREKKIKLAMGRAIDRLDAQIAGVRAYLKEIGVQKEIHLGESGWASADNHLYGAQASGAADEYKQMLYHLWLRSYCRDHDMACFYFEAFDEPWKDGQNPGGSENHFGLFTVDGAAKALLWDLVDKGVFEGLKRQGREIRKSHNGDLGALIEASALAPKRIDQPALRLMRSDSGIVGVVMWSNEKDRASFAADAYLGLNAWEGSCALSLNELGDLTLRTGQGEWWGASLDLKSPLDLSDFESANLELSISGESTANFMIGLQSGRFSDGNQREAALRIGPDEEFQLKSEPQTFVIPLKKIKAELNLNEIYAPLFIKGLNHFDGQEIRIHRFLIRQP